MIKYAQNSMLASRISFMNEVANVCEKVGADVYDVAKAMGIDSRIGPKFLEAGAGFGGACFPKDVKALIATAKSVGVEPVLLNSVMEVNERQPHRVVELLKSAIGNLSGKKISVLGLAFKPNTDDMRESRATVVVEALVSEGAAVKAYDPKSMQNAKQIFSGKPVELASSAESCVEGADACVIMTDWDEFKKLDFSRVKVPVIDGRRTIDPRKAREIGIVYKGIGWKDNYAEAAV
jgi:UDPglucose 6-dehydrogenase